MVELQEHGHVEGARAQVVRPRAGQHVEEVGGVAQGGVGRQRLLPLPQPLVRGDHGRHDRGEADALAQVRFAGRLVDVRVVDRQRRDHRAQHVHGRGVPGEALQEIQGVRVQGALRGQVLARLLELGGGGELAVPQEVDDLLEVGVLGQLVDGVAAVAETPFLAVDEAQPGARRNDPFQPLFPEHPTLLSPRTL